jgi:hypothetical protein
VWEAGECPASRGSLQSAYSPSASATADGQLARYLSGELTPENVVAVLDKCCDSLANATKARCPDTVSGGAHDEAAA